MRKAYLYLVTNKLTEELNCDVSCIEQLLEYLIEKFNIKPISLEQHKGKQNNSKINN